MRPDNSRKALLTASVCALLAYLIFGKFSIFDAFHYVIGGAGTQHMAWSTAHHQRADGLSRGNLEPAGDAAGQLDLSGIDSVVLADGSEATIVIDDKLPAGATVDGNGDTASVSTKVEDGKLVVTGIKGTGRVKVTLPHLHSLNIAGRWSTQISGLRDPISIVAAGAGDLKASGDVDRLSLVVTGTGKFELSDLRAKDAKIVLIGPGTADISATSKLNAMILGPGRIRYLGNPEVTQNVLGPGSVGRLSQS